MKLLHLWWIFIGLEVRYISDNMVLNTYLHVFIILVNVQNVLRILKSNNCCYTGCLLNVLDTNYSWEINLKPALKTIMRFDYFDPFPYPIFCIESRSERIPWNWPKCAAITNIIITEPRLTTLEKMWYYHEQYNNTI